MRSEAHEQSDEGTHLAKLSWDTPRVTSLEAPDVAAKNIPSQPDSFMAGPNIGNST